MTVAIAPEAAKKKPVLTPHCALPLIMSGVHYTFAINVSTVKFKLTRETIYCIDMSVTHEAKHDGNQIRQGQRPGRSLCAKSLLRNLGGIGIADGRSASSRECSQTGKEHLLITGQFQCCKIVSGMTNQECTCGLLCIIHTAHDAQAHYRHDGHCVRIDREWSSTDPVRGDSGQYH